MSGQKIGTLFLADPDENFDLPLYVQQIVITDFNLISSDRIILVHNRNNAEFEQLRECILRIETIQIRLVPLLCSIRKQGIWIIRNWTCSSGNFATCGIREKMLL